MTDPLEEELPEGAYWEYQVIYPTTWNVSRDTLSYEQYEDFNHARRQYSHFRHNPTGSNGFQNKVVLERRLVVKSEWENFYKEDV